MKHALSALAVLLAGQDQAVWVEDWNQGLAKAKQTGRPIFVVFSADW
jgi:hypothetical protein